MHVKVFFLVLVYVFNFDLFQFSAAILEKGLLSQFIIACVSFTIVDEITRTKSTWRNILDLICFYVF